MFNKETTFKVVNSRILTEALFKTAAPSDLPEPYDFDFLYIWVRAISAGEYYGSNKNFDFFGERELREHHHTFKDAHVFKNHENKDVAKAIGTILESRWNDDMKYVELLIKIDKALAPEIVRSLEKGSITDVSMGCRVQHTICSICGNQAKTRPEFCSHVRNQRGEVFPDGKKVYEINIGPKFHDLSIVLNGADRTAKLLEVVANYKEEQLEKAASTDTFYGMPLEKVASVATPLPSLTLDKIAEFKKRIIDKLYILSMIERAKKSALLEDEAQELLTKVTSDLSLNIRLDKIAGKVTNFLGHTGATGMVGLGGAAASNYGRDEMLRGELPSEPLQFAADNPGIVPLGMMGGYAGTVVGGKVVKSKAKNALTSLAERDHNAWIAKNPLDAPGLTNKIKKLVMKIASPHEELFDKSLDTFSEYSVSGGTDVFSNETLAEYCKKAYHIDDDKFKMIKLALVCYEAGREDVVDSIKETYAVTDSDLDNFVLACRVYLDDELEKQAGALKEVATMAAISPTHGRAGINLGNNAPKYTLAVADGLLFASLFGDDTEKVVTKSKVEKMLP